MSWTQALPARRLNAPPPPPSSPPSARNASRPPSRVLLSPPHLTGGELAALKVTLDDGWVAPSGPFPEAFERAVADATGFPHVLAVTSATDALRLGFRVLGVEAGDEVWTTTLTFVASISQAVQMGAVPRLFDVDPATWALDPGRLAEALAVAARQGRLPRVVVPVDIFGQPADIAAIAAVCERWGVPVLSDSACGMGSTLRGRHAGRGAQAAVFSFNGNKIVTSGGGGVLAAEAPGPIARARQLANQAREPGAHFQHEMTGYSCGMSSVIAAVGLAQLDALAQRVEARRRIFDRYVAGLCDLPGIGFMPEAPGARSNRWLSVVLFDPAGGAPDREVARAALLDAGIESRPVWKPLHLQPVFRHAPQHGGAIAAALFERGLCLPSGSGMTEAEQDRVIGALRATWP